MKPISLVAFLVCALVLGSSFFIPANAHVDAAFCKDKCSSRCAKAGMLDRCMRYCGICCQECNCVPSGTYGNKHECPCYRDKRSSQGKPKCP